MTAYYNEIDPNAAEWLRQLIKMGAIAPGDVDERSITDVTPNELKSYTQVHFFAGIGTWSYALRQAGWKDDRPVWTGSCPCFVADTLIITNRGLVPIEEICLGDIVLTHKGRWRKVLSTMQSMNSTVTVKGQGSSGIETTAEHPFYARKLYRDNSRKSATYQKVVMSDPEWVEAQLLEGDKKQAGGGGHRWAMPSSFPKMEMPRFDNLNWQGRKANLPKDGHSAKFARFLGYWLGDGWTSNKSKKPGNVIICGSRKDLTLLERLASEAGLTGSGSIEPTGAKFRIGSKLLSQWLDKNFGHGAKDKHIPAWLHGMPYSFRDAFIDGLLMADGCEWKQKRGTANVRQLTTASKKIAIGFRILVNQSGKSASIKWQPGRGKHVIEDRTVNDNGHYRVIEYATARSYVDDGQHGWGTVRSVTPSPIIKPVYNIEVEEDNSYIADGIVVHNCQPFSSAGKRKGADDERDLWWAMFWHIQQCKPQTIFGEQVASKDGLAWWDVVQSDLEGEDYAATAFDLCAAGIGAPHIRQRLFWVANTASDRPIGKGQATAIQEGRQSGCERIGQLPFRPKGCTLSHEFSAAKLGFNGMGNSSATRFSQPRQARIDEMGAKSAARMELQCERSGGIGGFWSGAVWHPCADGKARPAKSGAFKMAHGASANMVRGCNFGSQRNQTQKEVANESSKTSTFQVLPAMQSTDGAQAIQQQTGGFDKVQEAQILRSEMHGRKHGRADQSSQSQELSQTSPKNNQAKMRNVWQQSHEAGSSPQRPQSVEQRLIEFDDIVRTLPSSLSLAKLHEDRATQQSLQNLWQAICQEAALQYPLNSIQEAWRSLPEESKTRLRMDFDSSQWVVAQSEAFPLVDGTPPDLVCGCGASFPNTEATKEARAMRLKGYGNGIVAPLAVEFIKAVIEVSA